MRHAKLSFLFIIGGLFLAAALMIAHAAEDSFARLRKNAAEIKTIRAAFIQTKSMKILAKPLISEGLFFFAAPDSFRWEYKKPLRSVVINHRGETKRYIFSSGKMVEDQSGGVQAMKIVLGEITSWMSGKFDQNPSFQAALKDKGEIKEIIMTPTAKNMEGMIEKIVITLSSKDKAVRTVNIIESASAQTRIDFKNTLINKPLPESIFQDVE
ncbi:MAG TPA: outer membrane lipoprotein carrier protein LolA [Smithellaceae bacterium]|nr:outer membrane lipoprotein carrier protein LolA [Smithellaceae bacterium]HRS90145.1 outer membrane lipoprotein carrier protein LolA [Smithellaceae bacterium]HRV26960.1 outer membrane lipoprotein carrier protein LolA [Smithellaceae bacterium]